MDSESGSWGTSREMWVRHPQKQERGSNSGEGNLINENMKIGICI